MVERDPAEPGFNQSDVLPGFWVVLPNARADLCLRLARDEHGTDPYLTPAEMLERSEQRVRELEAALAKESAR